MDKRRLLARDGFAAQTLQNLRESTLEGYTFKLPECRRIMAPVAPFWRDPEPDPRLRRRETEGLYNETVAVLMERNGMALAQLATDDYVGWVETCHLAPALEPTATHHIHVPSTYVYPEASIKSPPLCQLILATPVQVTGEHDRFVQTPEGFIWKHHITPITASTDHAIEVALRTAASLLNTPYLWGGRSGLGLDCSALVQLSLAIAGITAPRDSDMQEAETGTALPLDTPPQRGDLLFWAGHVAWAEDEATLLHANAHHMQVAREPLKAGLARIAATGTPLRSLKRLTLDNGTK
jgi:cell wall-associated NlpC family hydrolase